jgi:hypothetical protein
MIGYQLDQPVQNSKRNYNGVSSFGLVSETFIAENEGINEDGGRGATTPEKEVEK